MTDTSQASTANGASADLSSNGGAKPESQAVRGARAADARALRALRLDRVGIERLETGIPGFDHITMGGLPRGRATLIAGGPGCAKTIFAGQFLAEGARRGQAGVFVTLEESADDLRANLATLGFDIEEYERQELFEFVDASPVTYSIDDEPAPYYYETLLAQIGRAVDRTGARRLVVDSLSAARSALGDLGPNRQRLRGLLRAIRKMGLTSVFTVESPGEGFELDTEEFVVDNVVLLRNAMSDSRRRRSAEVLKMRGGMHHKGEYPFTVLPGQGIVMLPLSTVLLTSASSEERTTSGDDEIDKLCGGGFFRDSIVLVSGATGTGKTLLTTSFLSGTEPDGRALLFAFEESHDQITRNARGWGRDFEAMEEEGRLRIVTAYPEVASFEDHLVEIKAQIDDFRPSRVAVDSLSALERSGGAKAFREFVIGLSSFLKTEGVLAMVTAATPTLLGGASVTEQHVSTLTDTIILLRYVELYGEVKRGITVLKMRGSQHDHDIHEFTINANGVSIGEPFRAVGGILSGTVTNLAGIPSAFDGVIPP